MGRIQAWAPVHQQGALCGDKLAESQRDQESAVGIAPCKMNVVGGRELVGTGWFRIRIAKLSAQMTLPNLHTKT